MESSSKGKTIVVTGSNKGVGYGIIDTLVKTNPNDNIILCSRAKENGEKALNELCKNHKDVKNVHIASLDITNTDSIRDFIALIKSKFNSRIDCLVNNAGVAFKPSSEFSTRVYDYTFATNVFATIDFTEALLKEGIIPNSGKIVIVGSSIGKFKLLSNKSVSDALKSNDLNYDKIKEISAAFRDAIDKNIVEKDGWSKSVYGFSKLIINNYARVLSQRKDVLDKGIQVYACCPGYVATDMSNFKGYRTLEEGAKTPCYLVNLEYKLNESYQGKFFYDEKVNSLE